MRICDVLQFRIPEMSTKALPSSLDLAEDTQRDAESVAAPSGFMRPRKGRDHGLAEGRSAVLIW